MHMQVRVALLATALMLVPLAVRAEIVVRWASLSETLTFDPHAAVHTSTIAEHRQVYESLVDHDASYRLEPALATNWRLLDPLTWEFELRRGVTFHDGAPFTAEDVVFSLSRAGASPFRALIPSVRSVEAVDDFTVRIGTAAPNPDLPRLLYLPFIMSKSWAERHGALAYAPFDDAEVTFAERHANGTGPFRLQSFEPGVSTIMTRNPDWWGLDRNQHNIDRIEHTWITDRARGLANLLAGRIDFLQTPPLDQLDRIEGTSGLKVQKTDEFRIIYLGLDQGSTELRSSDIKGANPFKDRRVRRAVYQAIDVEAIRTEVMHGLSRPTGVLIPPKDNGWSEELDWRLPYDPVLARALLVEAGYPDGFSVTLDCPNDRYVNDAAICDVIAAMLGRIKLRVTVDSRPFREVFPKIGKRQTDFYLFGWFSSTFDAQTNFLNLVRSDAPFNATGYANPRVDSLIDTIGAEISTYVRDAMIEEVWRIVRDDIVHVPLHQQPLAWATWDVLELPIDAGDVPRFRLARLGSPSSNMSP
jgi:peptide/nickel transport system substrate-binding protein